MQMICLFTSIPCFNKDCDVTHVKLMWNSLLILMFLVQVCYETLPIKEGKLTFQCS